MGRSAPPPSLRDLVATPWNFLAFGFGSGLAPRAPGTFGSVAGLFVYLAIAGLSLPAYLGVTALVVLVGIPICGRAADYLRTHDHPAIVWDEIAGILLTFIAVPLDWRWLLAGFVLFRFFDILKPWPIRWLDRQVHGGLGIMLDDLLAGVFAALVLQVLIVTLS